MSSDYHRYGALAIFILLFVLVAWTLLPFIRMLILAILLLIGFYPLFRVFKRWTKSDTWSAALMIVVITLFFVIPILILASAVISQAFDMYNALGTISMEYGTVVDNVETTLQESLGIELSINNIVLRGVTYIANHAQGIITGIPMRVANFFIMLFVLFFMFKESKRLQKFIMSLMPFSPAHKKKITGHFSSVVYGVIYGQIVTAIVQGIIAGIGYWIFGVKLPILWGILTIFAAFIPMVGTTLIWGPLSLYLIIFGAYGDGSIWQGVGLLLYGMIIISMVDNFLRPYLIGERAGIHPALVLLGALGGIGVFGLTGLFIGPLVIALFIEILSLYQKGEL